MYIIFRPHKKNNAGSCYCRHGHYVREIKCRNPLTAVKNYAGEPRSVFQMWTRNERESHEWNSRDVLRARDRASATPRSRSQAPCKHHETMRRAQSLESFFFPPISVALCVPVVATSLAIVGWMVSFCINQVMVCLVAAHAQGLSNGRLASLRILLPIIK